MMRLDERGLAIAGGALVVALSIFLAFGAAVVVRRNDLLRSVKRSQQTEVRRSHEELSVSIDHEADRIEAANYGSHTSVVKLVIIEGSSETRIMRDEMTVPVMSEESLELPEDSLQSEDNIGLVTTLGNTFWGGGIHG